MDIELCPTWSNSKFRCSSERRELIYIVFVFFIHTKSAERLREDLGYYPVGSENFGPLPSGNSGTPKDSQKR
jgi:hypothetical protein